MSRFSRMGERRDDYFDRVESNKKLAYERKVVRKLVSGLGFDKIMQQVNKPQVNDDGWYMTIAWLHDTFPTIPIRLTAHEAEPERLSEFFNPLSKRSKLWKGWNEALDVLRGEYDKGMAIGWAFPFNQDPEVNDMIMHTLDLDYIVDGSKKPFTRMHCVYPDGMDITLEPLKNFISRLKERWTAYG